MPAKRVLLAIVLVLLAVDATSSAAEWRPAHALGDFVSVGASSRQMVGIDDQGNATVVWTRQESLRPLRLGVFTADIGPDGTVGPVRRLSPKGRNVHAPRLDVAPSGQAAVVWTVGLPEGRWLPEKAAGDRRVQLLTRNLNSAYQWEWSKPRRISPAGPGRDFASDVVIEPSGVIATAWMHKKAGQQTAHVDRFLPDGTRVSARSLGPGRWPGLAASTSFPEAIAVWKSATHQVMVSMPDGAIALGPTRSLPVIAAGDALAISWDKQRSAFGYWDPPARVRPAPQPGRLVEPSLLGKRAVQFASC